jgi:hypothetical protein
MAAWAGAGGACARPHGEGFEGVLLRGQLESAAVEGLVGLQVDRPHLARLTRA